MSLTAAPGGKATRCGFDEYQPKMAIGAIRLNKTEIETQQNSRAGVAFSPPCSRPRCPGGLVRLTAGEGCRGGHCSSLSPRLGRWPHGGDEQMFGAKQQVLGTGQSD